MLHTDVHKARANYTTREVLVGGGGSCGFVPIVCCSDVTQYYKKSGSNLLHGAGITSPIIPDFRVAAGGGGTDCQTPYSIFLHEKLTGSQLVTKFTAFRGTRRFITAFTRARHLFLSWGRSILFLLPSHFLKSYFSISSHLSLGLPSRLFPSGFPTKSL